MTFKKIFQRLASIFFILCLSACGTSLKHYKGIEASLAQEDFDGTIQKIKEARQKGAYDKKDRVLYYMELGLAYHYAGLYIESNEAFELAEQSIQELYTASVSNIGASYLSNDNTLPYRGEAYEDVYISFFRALNFVHLGDIDSAFVEIRRINEKLDYLKLRLEEEIKAYDDILEDNKKFDKKAQQALLEKRGELELLENPFYNSALGRFMSFMMYLERRKFDDARIDLQFIDEAFKNQPAVYNFAQPGLPKLRSPDSGKARVYFLSLLGRGPIKKQKVSRIPVSLDFNYIKVALPVLQARGTLVDWVDIYIDDKQIGRLEKLEDVNKVAQSVFENQRSIIYLRSVMRATAKAIATEVAKSASGKDNEGFAALAGLIYQEVSEQADLRTSHLLPGEIHIASFDILPGTHRFRADFVSDGVVVRSKEIEQEVSTKALNFVELKYFE